MNYKVKICIPLGVNINSFNPREILSVRSQRIIENRNIQLKDTYEFILEDTNEPLDFVIVVDNVDYPLQVLAPKKSFFFISQEPESIRSYPKKYLKQFATVVSTQRNLKHRNVVNTHAILPWSIQKNYSELIAIPPLCKNKLLSIISSNKRFTKGHEMRYQFSQRLKEYFSNACDLYGRGICDFKDKWDVLAPYKYSVAIENSSCKDYITEKFCDCLLCYTFPFYYGADNIDDYYPKDCYQWIDITDFEGSVEIIKKIISNQNHFQQHLDALCEARKIYLEEYSMLPMFAKLVSSIQPSTDYQEIVIDPPQRISFKKLQLLAKWKYYDLKSKFF